MPIQVNITKGVIDMANIKINVEGLKTGREWVRHKVQEGNNVYRVLPPFGDPNEHKNSPFRRWVVAWLTDPNTGKRFPFATPFSSGQKDAACPIHEYTRLLSDKIEKLKAGLQAKGRSDQEIKDALSPLNKVLWETRANRTFAYNVVDKSGKVGLLELKKTAHDEMKQRMLEYIQERQMDPTSLNSDIKSDAGVWFNIKRTGMGKDTKYSVEFAKIGQKDADGDVVYKLDRSPLPEGVAESFESQAHNLSTIYRLKSYDELKDILLYNISLIAEDIPHAVVPGFNPNEKEVKEVAEFSTSKSTVSLSLAEEENDSILDEIDETPKAKVKKDMSLNEMSSLVDDILGD
jgi:hypothetical protein